MSVRWGDNGAFGIVPVWVIEAEISDRAVRLYALLARHAGRPEGDTFRGKNEMAERLRCSRTSVDNALRDLIRIGAVTVEERFRSNGGQLENGYVLHANQQIPDTSPGEDVPGGGAAGCPPTRARSSPGEPVELEPRTEAPAQEVAVRQEVVVTRRGWSVDRKPVTDDEDEFARQVLGMWNTVADQSLSSQDWLAKIVMRHREHPELSAESHGGVIVAAFTDPWWKGDPSPSVVYGNGALFERCVEAAKKFAAGERPREKQALRYGRGMTTRQILDTFGGNDEPV